MDNLPAVGDNFGLMTRAMPKKAQIMMEINGLLNLPNIEPTVGSTIPRVFFTSIADVMGLPSVNGMPAMARKIIENAHLSWHEDFSSELAPSGGGGTVTVLGLLQVKNAVLTWLGQPVDPLPTDLIIEEWEPATNWQVIRANLPKELQEVTTRPGASAFRDLVLSEYANQCAVTGCKTTAALDVAHIVPYYGPESDQIQNALPLRADIHRLFDKGLLRIEYDSSIKKYHVIIHDFVKHDYSLYENRLLEVPANKSSRPSQPALVENHKLHSKMWQVI